MVVILSLRTISIDRVNYWLCEILGITEGGITCVLQRFSVDWHIQIDAAEFKDALEVFLGYFILPCMVTDGNGSHGPFQRRPWRAHRSAYHVGFVHVAFDAREAG